MLGRSDMVINHLRVAEPSDWPYACQAAALDFYTRALGTPDYGYVTVLRQPVDRWGRRGLRRRSGSGGRAREWGQGPGVGAGPGSGAMIKDLTVGVGAMAAVVRGGGIRTCTLESMRVVLGGALCVGCSASTARPCNGRGLYRRLQCCSPAMAARSEGHLRSAQGGACIAVLCWPRLGSRGLLVAYRMHQLAQKAYSQAPPTYIPCKHPVLALLLLLPPPFVAAGTSPTSTTSQNPTRG